MCVYIYIYIYVYIYLVLKWMEMLLHVTTWMKLADIKSSKIRQSRQPMHMIPHI